MSNNPLLPFQKSELVGPPDAPPEKTQLPDNTKESKKEEVQLVGVVKKIQFRSTDSGFTVLRVLPKNEDEEVAAVGTTVSIEEGDFITAKGVYVKHPKYGKQFKAELIQSFVPAMGEGLFKYLSSGAIKGIGPAIARKILKHFGDETEEILKTTPLRLQEVPGIGEQKAQSIAETFASGSTLQEIIQFLTTHGLSLGLAHKIFKRYGKKAVDALSSDPYALARDIKGVGFKKADVIATQNLGIPLDSPLRLKAAILFTLEEASRSGHCYLTTKTLKESARDLVVNFRPDKDHLARLLSELSQKGKVVITQNEHVYLTPLFEAEQFVAEFLLQRSETTLQEVSKDASEFEKAIAESEKQLELQFSEEQKAAIQAAFKNQLLVITGGPGCGKTTIVRTIVTLAKARNMKISLAAPTGRAAHRLATVCDMEASTIHRLLKYQDGDFTFGPSNPLPVDILLVDEASMIDVKLAAALFAAVPIKAHVILVGDKDQLPSVGPGRVFADAVESSRLCKSTLTQVYRQAQESEIITTAHAINTGTPPHLPVPDGSGSHQVYFVERVMQDKVANVVERLMAGQIMEKFGYSLDQTLLLTPTNVGPLGTESLNRQLQRVINPPSSEKAELKLGSTILRTGDRVCQRKNNYNIHEQGVFNGDTGRITRIEPKEQKVFVELWDGRSIEYAGKDIYQLSLAYALTVHRSQGSESPCVVMVLHHSSYVLLERQLVYTGVTRAKELLIIVGSKRALELSCTRNSAQKRSTGLAELLE